MPRRAEILIDERLAALVAAHPGQAMSLSQMSEATGASRGFLNAVLHSALAKLEAAMVANGMHGEIYGERMTKSDQDITPYTAHLGKARAYSMTA
jgi:hypothetical protein